MSSVSLLVLAVNGDFYIWRKSGTQFGVGLDRAETPVEATEFLKAHGFKGTLFCDPNDCGYLILKIPDLLVPGDSYFSDPAITLRLFKQTLSAAGFDELDSQFRFQVAVVSIFNTDTLVHLLASPLWDIAFSDTHRIVFFRRYSKEIQFATTPLAQSSHYSGEDLRKNSYASALARWVEIGISRKDLALIKALVDQVKDAKYIPSSFIKNILVAALASGDRDLANKALEFESKTYVTSGEDLTEIQRLKQQMGI